MSQADSIKRVQDAEAKASNIIAAAEKHREEEIDRAKKEADAMLSRAREQGTNIMNETIANTMRQIEKMQVQERKEIAKMTASMKKMRLPKREIERISADLVDLIIGR
ncbi:MAG: hypothetical protein ACP5RF_00295 [Candidatus Micrarchaeia archaeon]